MKKLIIGMTVAALAICSFGCSKDKKTTKTAAAAPAAETLVQLEAKYQLNDAKATDPSKALSCKYVAITGANGSYAVQKAELLTSGKCDFNSLKSSASAAAPLSAAAAAQIVAAVSSNNSLPASAKDKMNCTSYNVRTSLRKAGVQDCKDGNGTGNDVAKAITSALGL